MTYNVLKRKPGRVVPLNIDILVADREESLISSLWSFGTSVIHP